MSVVPECVVTVSIVPVSIVNIAAYRFVSLPDPVALVEPLRVRCRALALKGTVIVADEGINLFLAGAGSAIDDVLQWLATDPLFIDSDGAAAFERLEVKRSGSDAQPFGRLRVRHKREIVTMRRPDVAPGAARAPAIGPERLADWITRGSDDSGRPIVLLDTRNAFEVAHGSFAGARHLDLARFDAFPAAVQALQPELHDTTVVTFCTGGIRCEKAALYMRGAGFARVLQLDGGILDYFDKVGGAHWQGDCFVFDDRVALRSDLRQVVL